MKAVAAAAAMGAAAATSDVATFQEWAAKHGKAYASREEWVMRRNVFAANLRKIEAHNAEGHSWKMGVNTFADLTGDEFKARYASGLRVKPRTGKAPVFHPRNVSANPASVDWSAKGAVTPIKNQQQCGSCWAFSTTGSVEGAVFIATGTLPSLSEQQLVDCSGAEGNQGCNGGLMDQAFQYIMINGGITSETQYPYTAQDGTCNTSVTSVASITGYTDVAQNNELALETAIVQQPVSVAVEADQDCFQFYSGGVMTASCGTQLDHGVLAVGYGTDASAGGDYYKVKNSWGASWGEAGYIRLGRGTTFNPSGQCGIQMQPSYPTGASNKPGPAPSPGGASPSPAPHHDETTTTTSGTGSTTSSSGGSSSSVVTSRLSGVRA